MNIFLWVAGINGTVITAWTLGYNFGRVIERIQHINAQERRRAYQRKEY